MDAVESARQWALAQVGCPYLMGGTGKRCTPAYRAARAAQYPASAAKIRAACPRTNGRKAQSCVGCAYYDAAAKAGKRAYDCAQLTRFCMERAGISLCSGSDSQFRRTPWARTGPLTALEKDRLCLLYRYDPATGKYGHTGVFLGDGTVVHAKGHAYGVVREPLADTRFTHFAVPQGLYGQSFEKEEKPMLKTGDRGEQVRALQAMLLAAGFSLPRYGADGIYGAETAGAVAAFQQSQGRAATGQCDEATWNALRSRPADDIAAAPPVASWQALREQLASALALVDAILAGKDGSSGAAPQA